MADPGNKKLGFVGTIFGILLFTIFSIIFAVYAGISARLVWEGFTWGWGLFGL